MYCVLCILWCILWVSGPEINVILSYLTSSQARQRRIVIQSEVELVLRHRTQLLVNCGRVVPHILCPVWQADVICQLQQNNNIAMRIDWVRSLNRLFILTRVVPGKNVEVVCACDGEDRSTTYEGGR